MTWSYSAPSSALKRHWRSASVLLLAKLSRAAMLALAWDRRVESRYLAEAAV